MKPRVAGTSRRPPNDPPTPRERWWRNSNLISVLIGAVVGGAFALGGTWLTLDAQRDAQQDQFAEQRAAEARVKREAAYIDFVAKWWPARSARLALEVCEVDAEQSDLLVSLSCEDQWAAWSEARAALDDARSQILIYGSDEAVKASTEAWYHIELPRGKNPPSPLWEFEQILTCEVSPEPRAACVE